MPGQAPEEDNETVILKKLERTLNKDRKVREAFLKDPAKVMRQEGIALSEDQIASIKSQMSKMGLRRLLSILAPLE